MTVNGTQPPDFMEPDYSYKFEELSEDQKQHLYTKKYNMKYTKKEVLKISGISFLAVLALILLCGAFTRLVVWIFMGGYNGFGLW